MDCCKTLESHAHTVQADLFLRRCSLERLQESKRLLIPLRERETDASGDKFLVIHSAVISHRIRLSNFSLTPTFFCPM